MKPKLLQKSEWGMAEMKEIVFQEDFYQERPFTDFIRECHNLNNK